MKKAILTAAALALAGTAGIAGAQSGYYQAQRPAVANSYWQGAPDGLSQRIDWLQQRIDRGMSDGSLDRRDARDAQLQLNSMRHDADVLQQRLDNLSRNIRWHRANGAYGYNNGAYPNGAYPNGAYPNGAYPNGGYVTQGVRDPYATDYDASRYYRAESGYAPRPLGTNDEVYRGSDGRYYCKRSDGTIGLVVGGVGGAALGNVIDGGHSRAAGTLIGGALGALLGQAIDRNSSDVRCQ